MRTPRRGISKREASGPGFYALPLPHLPSDVRGNLAGMKLTSNIDQDLVALANDVLRPVVNYEVPANPLPPSLDPFDLTANLKPESPVQTDIPDIPFSIQDILEALDEVNQFPPNDSGYERPYSPSPPLNYPPATHKPPPPQTILINQPPVQQVKPGVEHTEPPVIYIEHTEHPVIYKPHSEDPHLLITEKSTPRTEITTKKSLTKIKHITTNKYPHNIKDKLPEIHPPNIHKTKKKVTEPPKKPKDYYAIIPYKDITKLFDLLNKHVQEPVKYEAPHKTEKKKENKNPFKTKITHFRIPVHQKKKKMIKRKKGRKKVVEICSKNGTNFFALFTLGTTILNVMINFMFNLMVDIMIRTTGLGNAVGVNVNNNNNNNNQNANREFIVQCRMLTY